MSNQGDEHDDDTSGQHRLEQFEILLGHVGDISGSPGSRSDSSSSARAVPRIVELLLPDDQPSVHLDWAIRDEFYDEDVADESHHLSGEDEDEDEVNPDDAYEDSDEDRAIRDDDYQGAMIGDDFIELDPEEFRNDQLSTDDDDDEDDDEDGTENYDTQLPASHPYLGDDLRESRGRMVFVENSTTSLLLINFRHIVLFPGQTLPLTTANLNPIISRCLLECVKNGQKTVGLMSDPSINRIGTTAEIRKYCIMEGVGSRDMKFILEGCQRFSLLGESFEITKKSEVKILPEIILGPPWPPISSSLFRFHSITDTPSQFIISKHPHWLLKKYEARNVMKRINDDIKDWCTTSADLSRDPNDFSYWVAANLPISNVERIKALSFSCAEARLVWLLEVLVNSVNFACSNCNEVICIKSDVFSMSRTGPQSSYVNQHGFIHDTITVRKATGLILFESWCDSFSWFPGYSWKIASCARCHQHIGWCYKRKQGGAKPKKFFGLSRLNVSLQCAH